LRTRLGLICVVVPLLAFAGCDSATVKTAPGAAGAPDVRADSKRVLLALDFEQGQVLRYKFISDRDTEIDFDPQGKMAKGRKTVMNIHEQMELIIAYKVVEVDEYGFAEIQARCESAKVMRTSTGKTRRDAVESLAGRSFRFTVTPSGLMEHKAQLEGLVGMLVKKAFGGGGRRRIKNPDMIFDFIATQWFLWDTISSVDRPVKGVALGQSWNSKLLVPLPMPMRVARDVTYTLDSIRDSEQGRIAVIHSNYSFSKSVPSDWPKPYRGAFQMRGMFGFLRGYKISSVAGKGEQLFNIDSGRIERDKQEYVLEATAAMMMPLGKDSGKPTIKIKQTLTTELAEH